MAAAIYLTNTLINSGTPVRLLCDQVTISGKKNTEKTPNANVGTLVAVQTQSFENLVYIADGVHFTNAANTLTYPMLLMLYKATYDGTNPIVMSITYGTSNIVPMTITAATATTPTTINVVMDSFSFPISAKESRNAYMPIGTITFTETL